MAIEFKRKKLPHNVPPGVPSGERYFITICCDKKTDNTLCHPQLSSELFDTVQHYQNQKRWLVHLWLLMPDHLHAIISYPPSESLSKLIGSWKRYTSKALGIKWQKNFFDHRPRNKDEYSEKYSYIKMNPVRKGLTDIPENWKYQFNPQSRSADTPTATNTEQTLMPVEDNGRYL